MEIRNSGVLLHSKLTMDNHNVFFCVFVYVGYTCVYMLFMCAPMQSACGDPKLTSEVFLNHLSFC